MAQQKIYDDIGQGVKMSLWLENDCLHFGLLSPSGNRTTFSLSYEATEQLRSVLVDYKQLQAYHESLQKKQITRKQQRQKNTQMNPLYWQLACMMGQSKEERQLHYAMLHQEGADSEEITKRIKTFYEKKHSHSDNNNSINDLDIEQYD